MAKTGDPEFFDNDAITKQMSGFIAHLRLNGFAAGPAETMDALGFLRTTGWPQTGATRAGLKTMLSANKSNWDQFDELFDAYWKGRGVKTVRPAGPDQVKRGEARKRPALWDDLLPRDSAPDSGSLSHITDQADDVSQGTGRGRVLPSTLEALGKTDLKNLVSRKDVEEVERIAERLARAMRYRLSRRRKPSARGATINMRRTIRRNLSRGGAPFDLVRQKRPDRPVNLVVLLDVSGSMEQYSRIFLAFLRGLMGQWLKMDAFMFHTRLVHISDALGDLDHTRAMDRLTLMADGFGGGTKIGECLQVFNERYAKATLSSRSVVIIMSDGYDTGDRDALARQLARLKKRARRLVWLNPLAGWDNFEPIARGMAEAMPHIDLFKAANTLESFAALETELAKL